MKDMKVNINELCFIHECNSIPELYVLCSNKISVLEDLININEDVLYNSEQYLSNSTLYNLEKENEEYEDAIIYYDSIIDMIDEYRKYSNE